jgi:hypothetical protein
VGAEIGALVFAMAIAGLKNKKNKGLKNKKNKLRSVYGVMMVLAGVALLGAPQRALAFDTLYCTLTRAPDLESYEGIEKISGSTWESIPFAINDTEKPLAAQLSQDPPVFVLYEKLPKKQTQPSEYKVTLIRSASIKAEDLTSPQKDELIKAAKRKADFGMSSATTIQNPDQKGNYADGPEGDRIAFSPKSVTDASSSTGLDTLSRDGRVLMSICTICDQIFCTRKLRPRSFAETKTERKRR